MLQFWDVSSVAKSNPYENHHTRIHHLKEIVLDECIYDPIAFGEPLLVTSCPRIILLDVYELYSSSRSRLSYRTKKKHDFVTFGCLRSNADLVANTWKNLPHLKSEVHMSRIARCDSIYIIRMHAILVRSDKLTEIRRAFTSL